jgi:hypothetical protein
MENNKNRSLKKGELTFRGLILSALLIGLFLFGMFSISTNLTTQANSTNTLNNDVRVNSSISNLNTQLDTSFANISSQEQGFFSGVPIIGAVEATLVTIFRTVPNLFGVVKNLYLLTLDIINEIVGVPPLITNMLVAIVTILGILSAWRLYKAGE